LEGFIIFDDRVEGSQDDLVFSKDIILVSYDFHPIDMLGIIAVATPLTQETGLIISQTLRVSLLGAYVGDIRIHNAGAITCQPTTLQPCANFS